MTEAERADLEASLFYRVVVAIDDPATAQPLVEVAAELAASQQPAEVVLVAFKKQTEIEDKVMFTRARRHRRRTSIRCASSRQIVQAHGLTAVSVSQRSTDLGPTSPPAPTSSAPTPSSSATAATTLTG